MVWFNIHCSHDDWCRTGTETPELVHDTLGSATSVTVVLSPLYYSSGPPLRAPGPKYNHVRKLLKLSTTRMKKWQCHSSSSVCVSRFFYTAQKTHLLIKETSSVKLSRDIDFRLCHNFHSKYLFERNIFGSTKDIWLLRLKYFNNLLC